MKTATTPGLTISQAARQIAAAGLCSERTAKDKLYTRKYPLTYLQQRNRGRVLIIPAELQEYIQKKQELCK